MTRRYPLLEARTVLFDLAVDPQQRVPIEDPALEARIRAKIVEVLVVNDAPAEVYVRYGLVRAQNAA